MNASAPIPTTIHLRPSRLLGIIVAVAALAAAITWALLVFAVDSGSQSAQPAVRTSEDVLAGLSPRARQYVEGIMALTPAQLAAGFGTGSITDEADG